MENEINTDNTDFLTGTKVPVSQFLPDLKVQGFLAPVLPDDTLVGQTSRIDVATACVECIFYPMTKGKVFELVNNGARPPITDWEALFSQLN
jgi:hypothetical protein